ncbi:hypothetical protein [Enterobacter phage 01_vB_Eclo_IJM]|nr:hypothetical protein [Enterobacter phage 01_vB_Eclo_IJM]
MVDLLGNQYSVSGNMDYVRTSNPRMTSGLSR